MRSAVGAVCILARALRDAPDFFFVLLPDAAVDFTGVTVLCDCKALVDFAGAVDFADAELVAADFFAVDFTEVDCATPQIGIDKIHKPPARNSPPAARRMFVFALLNAPR